MTLDELITAAGQTHVIPPREDPALLERLRDPAVLMRAAELLASKNKQERRRAIFCVERIGYVLKDQETAELLLAHADRARDKHEVMTTLDALKGRTPPRPLAAERLVRLARRPEWQVWQPAVRCLHLAPASAVEPVLLERLDAPREGRVYVAFELRFMTGPKSIAALDNLLGDPALEVRCVALDSLGERLGADVLPYARRLAEGRSQLEQLWAENWVGRFGDAADVPFMAKRLTKLTGARRRLLSPPEVSYLLPFLLRHSDVPPARTALERLRNNVDRLPDEERQWLATHTPEVLLG